MNSEDEAARRHARGRGVYPTYVSSSMPSSLANSPTKRDDGVDTGDSNDDTALSMGEDSRPQSASYNSSIAMSSIPYRAAPSANANASSATALAAQHNILKSEYQSLFQRLVDTENVVMKQDGTLTLLKQQAAALSAERTQLYQEKEFALTQLHAVMRENEALRHKQQESSEQVAHQNESLKQVFSEVEAQRQHLADAEANSLRLKEILAETESALEAERERVNTVNALLEKLQHAKRVEYSTRELEHQAHVAELDTRIAQLEGQLAKEKIMCEDLRVSLNTKSADATWLQEQRLEVDERVITTRQQLHDSERQREENLRRALTAEAAIKMKDALHAEVTAELDKTKADLFKQYGMVDRLVPVNDALEEEAKVLRSQVSSLRKSLDLETASRRGLEVQVARQQQMQQELSSNLTVEAEQAFQIERERQQLEVTVAKLQEKLDNVEVELTATQTKLARLMDRGQAQRHNLTVSEERADELEEQVSSLRSEAATERSLRRQFEEERQVLEEELAEQAALYATQNMELQKVSVALQDKMERELRVADSTLRATQETLSDTLNKLSTSTSEITRLESLLRKSQADASELAAIENEMKDMNRQLAAERDNSLYMFRETTLQLEAALKENVSISGRLTVDSQALEVAKKEVKDLRKRLSDATKSTAEQRETIQTLQAQNAKVSKQFEKLQHEIESAKRTEDRAAEQLASVREILNRERAAHVSRCRVLEEQLDKETGKANRLRGEAESAKQTAVRLKEVKEQHHNLEVEIARLAPLERELELKEAFHREAMEALAKQLVESIHYFSERSHAVAVQRKKNARHRRTRSALVHEEAVARQRELAQETALRQQEDARKLRNLLIQQAELDGGDADGSNAERTARQCDHLVKDLGYHSFDDLLFEALKSPHNCDEPVVPAEEDDLEDDADHAGRDSEVPPVWFTLEKQRELHEKILLTLGAQFVIPNRRQRKESPLLSSPSEAQTVAQILRQCIDWFMPMPRGFNGSTSPTNGEPLQALTTGEPRAVAHFGSAAEEQRRDGFLSQRSQSKGIKRFTSATNS